MAPLPTVPILTSKQQAFIHALIKTGGQVNEAAILAGYSAKSAPVMGYQNLRLPHVLEAYEALLKTKLAAGKALALNTLENIARSGESEHAQIAAANGIWDKAAQLEGLGKATGGVHITLNLGTQPQPSDLGATQTIEHEPLTLKEQPFEGMSE
jgi:hypothetical protein